MLTLDAIIKATRQMTAYGERGTAGTLDHLPARVQGPRENKKKKTNQSKTSATASRKPARRWDDEKKVYVHI